MAVLRGQRVLIRPLAAADVPQIEAIQAQPSVARWWGQPDDAKLQGKAAGTDECTVFAIELGGEVVGLVQYYEDEGDTTGMPASTSFPPSTCKGKGWAPTQCGRWRAISSTIAVTTAS